MAIRETVEMRVRVIPEMSRMIGLGQEIDQGKTLKLTIATDEATRQWQTFKKEVEGRPIIPKVYEEPLHAFNRLLDTKISHFKLFRSIAEVPIRPSIDYSAFNNIPRVVIPVIADTRLYEEAVKRVTTDGSLSILLSGGAVHLSFNDTRLSNTIAMGIRKSQQKDNLQLIKDVAALPFKALSAAGSATMNAATSVITFPVDIVTRGLGTITTGFLEKIGQEISGIRLAPFIAKSLDDSSQSFINYTAGVVNSMGDFRMGLIAATQQLVATGSLERAGQGFAKYGMAEFMPAIEKAMALASFSQGGRDTQRDLLATTFQKELRDIANKFDIAVPEGVMTREDAAKISLAIARKDGNLLQELTQRVGQGLAPTREAALEPLKEMFRPYLSFVRDYQSLNMLSAVGRLVDQKGTINTADLQKIMQSAGLAAPTDLIDKLLVVIGGSQGVQGTGGYGIAEQIREFFPDRYVMGVENPETDVKRQGGRPGWVQELVALFAPALANSADFADTFDNIQAQLEFAMNPFATSQAVVQALGAIQAGKEAGYKEAGVVGFSLGNAELLRLGAVLELIGDAQTKLLALAYPTANILPTHPNYKSTIIQPDPLSFPMLLGMFEKIADKNYMFSKGIKVASDPNAHAVHHLFKSPEFLSLLRTHMGATLPGTANEDYGQRVEDNREAYRILGAIAQAKSIIETGDFNTSSPYKGFGEKEDFISIASILGTALRGENLPGALGAAMREELKALKPAIIELLKSGYTGDDVDFTSEADMMNLSKFLGDVGLYSQIRDMVQGTTDEVPSAGWVTSNEKGTEATSIRNLNEFIGWASGEFQGGPMQLLIDAMKTLREGLKKRAEGDEETAQAIFNTLPDLQAGLGEGAAQLTRKLNVMSLPSPLEGRTLGTNVSWARENTLAIEGYNNLIQSLGDKMPSPEQIEKAATGLRGGVAFISDNLVYKTNILENTPPTEGEIGAYQRLQGRVSPHLLDYSSQDASMVMTKIEGRSVEDLFIERVDRIEELERELIQLQESNADKSLLDEAKARLKDAQKEFDSFSDDIFKRIGQLAAGLHDMGIAHGDLGPSNIIVNELTGQLSAIDFNTATLDPSIADKIADISQLLFAFSAHSRLLGRLNIARIGGKLQEGAGSPLDIASMPIEDAPSYGEARGTGTPIAKFAGNHYDFLQALSEEAISVYRNYRESHVDAAPAMMQLSKAIDGVIPKFNQLASLINSMLGGKVVSKLAKSPLVSSTPLLESTSPKLTATSLSEALVVAKEDIADVINLISSLGKEWNEGVLEPMRPVLRFAINSWVELYNLAKQVEDIVLPTIPAGPAIKAGIKNVGIPIAAATSLSTAHPEVFNLLHKSLSAVARGGAEATELLVSLALKLKEVSPALSPLVDLLTNVEKVAGFLGRVPGMKGLLEAGADVAGTVGVGKLTQKGARDIIAALLPAIIKEEIAAAMMPSSTKTAVNKMIKDSGLLGLPPSGEEVVSRRPEKMVLSTDKFKEVRGQFSALTTRVRNLMSKADEAIEQGLYDLALGYTEEAQQINNRLDFAKFENLFTLEKRGDRASLRTFKQNQEAQSQRIAQTKEFLNTKGVVESGEDIVAGVAKGVEKSTQKLDEAMRSLYISAEESFNKEAKIESPSKEMMERGEDLGAGAALGVLNAKSAVEKASAQLASVALGAFSGVELPLSGPPELRSHEARKADVGRDAALFALITRMAGLDDLVAILKSGQFINSPNTPLKGHAQLFGEENETSVLYGVIQQRQSLDRLLLSNIDGSYLGRSEAGVPLGHKSYGQVAVELDYQKLASSIAWVPGDSLSSRHDLNRLSRLDDYAPLPKTEEAWLAREDFFEFLTSGARLFQNLGEVITRVTLIEGTSSIRPGTSSPQAKDELRKLLPHAELDFSGGGARPRSAFAETFAIPMEGASVETMESIKTLVETVKNLVATEAGVHPAVMRNYSVSTAHFTRGNEGAFNRQTNELAISSPIAIGAKYGLSLEKLVTLLSHELRHAMQKFVGADLELLKASGPRKDAINVGVGRSTYDKAQALAAGKLSPEEYKAAKRREEDAYTYQFQFLEKHLQKLLSTFQPTHTSTDKQAVKDALIQFVQARQAIKGGKEVDLQTVVGAMTSTAKTLEGVSLEAKQDVLSLVEGLALLSPDASSATKAVKTAAIDLLVPPEAGKVGMSTALAVMEGFVSASDFDEAWLTPFSTYITRVKQLFGISSPSKVFAQIRKDIEAGFAQGDKEIGEAQLASFLKVLEQLEKKASEVVFAPEGLEEYLAMAKLVSVTLETYGFRGSANTLRSYDPVASEEFSEVGVPPTGREALESLTQEIAQLGETATRVDSIIERITSYLEQAATTTSASSPPSPPPPSRSTSSSPSSPEDTEEFSESSLYKYLEAMVLEGFKVGKEAASPKLRQALGILLGTALTNAGESASQQFNAKDFFSNLISTEDLNYVDELLQGLETHLASMAGWGDLDALKELNKAMNSVAKQYNELRHATGMTDAPDVGVRVRRTAAQYEGQLRSESTTENLRKSNAPAAEAGEGTANAISDIGKEASVLYEKLQGLVSGPFAAIIDSAQAFGGPVISQIIDGTGAILERFGVLKLSGTASFLAISAAVGAYTVSQIGLAQEMKSLSLQFEALGYNGQKSVNSMMALSQATGSAFRQTAQLGAGIAGALQFTGLEGSTGKLTEQIVKINTALQLGEDASQRFQVALIQMLSKGVVSMEEVRQQAAEAVPSFFPALARGLNMTPGQAMKAISSGEVSSAEAVPAALTELEKMSAGAYQEGLKSLPASMNRISNSMLDINATFGAFPLKIVGGIAYHFANITEAAAPLVKALSPALSAFALLGGLKALLIIKNMGIIQSGLKLGRDALRLFATETLASADRVLAGMTKWVSGITGLQGAAAGLATGGLIIGLTAIVVGVAALVHHLQNYNKEVRELTRLLSGNSISPISNSALSMEWQNPTSSNPVMATLDVIPQSLNTAEIKTAEMGLKHLLETRQALVESGGGMKISFLGFNYSELDNLDRRIAKGTKQLEELKKAGGSFSTSGKNESIDKRYGDEAQALTSATNKIFDDITSMSEAELQAYATKTDGLNAEAANIQAAISIEASKPIPDQNKIKNLNDDLNKAKVAAREFDKELTTGGGMAQLVEAQEKFQTLIKQAESRGDTELAAAYQNELKKVEFGIRRLQRYMDKNPLRIKLATAEGAFEDANLQLSIQYNEAQIDILNQRRNFAITEEELNLKQAQAARINTQERIKILSDYMKAQNKALQEMQGSATIASELGVEGGDFSTASLEKVNALITAIEGGDPGAEKYKSALEAIKSLRGSLLELSNARLEDAEAAKRQTEANIALLSNLRDVLSVSNRVRAINEGSKLSLDIFQAQQRVSSLSGSQNQSSFDRERTDLILQQKELTQQLEENSLAIKAYTDVLNALSSRERSQARELIGADIAEANPAQLQDFLARYNNAQAEGNVLGNSNIKDAVEAELERRQKGLEGLQLQQQRLEAARANLVEVTASQLRQVRSSINDFNRTVTDYVREMGDLVEDTSEEVGKLNIQSTLLGYRNRLREQFLGATQSIEKEFFILLLDGIEGVNDVLGGGELRENARRIRDLGRSFEEKQRELSQSAQSIDDSIREITNAAPDVAYTYNKTDSVEDVTSQFEGAMSNLASTTNSFSSSLDKASSDMSLSFSEAGKQLSVSSKLALEQLMGLQGGSSPALDKSLALYAQMKERYNNIKERAARGDASNQEINEAAGIYLAHSNNMKDVNKRMDEFRASTGRVISIQEAQSALISSSLSSLAPVDGRKGNFAGGVNIEAANQRIKSAYDKAIVALQDKSGALAGIAKEKILEILVNTKEGVEALAFRIPETLREIQRGALTLDRSITDLRQAFSPFVTPEMRRQQNDRQLAEQYEGIDDTIFTQRRLFKELGASVISDEGDGFGALVSMVDELASRKVAPEEQDALNSVVTAFREMIDDFKNNGDRQALNKEIQTQAALLDSKAQEAESALNVAKANARLTEALDALARRSQTSQMLGGALTETVDLLPTAQVEKDYVRAAVAYNTALADQQNYLANVKKELIENGTYSEEFYNQLEKLSNIKLERLKAQMQVLKEGLRDTLKGGINTGLNSILDEFMNTGKVNFGAIAVEFGKTMIKGIAQPGIDILSSGISNFLTTGKWDGGKSGPNDLEDPLNMLKDFSAGTMNVSAQSVVLQTGDLGLGQLLGTGAGDDFGILSPQSREMFPSMGGIGGGDEYNVLEGAVSSITRAFSSFSKASRSWDTDSLFAIPEGFGELGSSLNDSAFSLTQDVDDFGDEAGGAFKIGAGQIIGAVAALPGIIGAFKEGNIGQGILGILSVATPFFLGGAGGGIASLAGAFAEGGEVSTSAASLASVNTLTSTLSQEQAQSGRTPLLAVVHEGERILSTKNNDAQIWDSLEKSGALSLIRQGKGNFASGGVVKRAAENVSGSAWAHGSRQASKVEVNSPVYVSGATNARSYQRSQTQIANRQAAVQRRAASRTINS